MDDHRVIAARHWLLRIVAGLLAAFLAVSTAAAGPEASHSQFSIAAGDATVTLNKFSQQANLQLLFDMAAMRNIKTQAVNGSYAPAEALRQMLRGTPLKFEWLNDRTLSIGLAQPAR